MPIVNNVNLETLGKTEEKFKKDLSLAKKVNRIEGEWLLDEKGGPKFRAEIPIETDTDILESDQPTALGGGGSRRANALLPLWCDGLFCRNIHHHHCH
jgi:hypothetical protein